MKSTFGGVSATSETLRQGRPPQFKERVRVLPAGIGDVEKNEMEREGSIIGLTVYAAETEVKTGPILPLEMPLVQ